MLSFLRQLARALTGKVDPMEFALGIFFGLLLGLIPASEVDLGTGLMGWNVLWIVVLFLLLSIRASIPVAVVFAAIGKMLGMAFLNEMAFNFGRSSLDGPGPDGLAATLYSSLPAFQLHTFWGYGSAMIGLMVAVICGLTSYFLFRRKLPIWKERFGKSRFAQALSGFFVFRAFRFLLR